MKKRSYHDVTVFVNERPYNLFNSSYGLVLTCTRAGGWELWNGPTKLGGEYEDVPFRIEVDGVVVCGEVPE